jgi:hypothetical protein
MGRKIVFAFSSPLSHDWFARFQQAPQEHSSRRCFIL